MANKDHQLSDCPRI